MQISFDESLKHISQLRRENEVSTSFFFLLSRLFMKKKKFSLQSVTVLSVKISLYCNET